MKYLGSKAKLAKYIVPILQNYIYKNNIKTYIEPFVGGFNIIDKITCNNKIGCDIDPLVIDLVETCRNNPKLLDTINETPSREHYYDVRDNANKYPSWYRAAILLFASYNARVYGGCYGAIAKTKDGKMRNYYQESKSNFQNQLPNLCDILVLKEFKDDKYTGRTYKVRITHILQNCGFGLQDGYAMLSIELVGG